MARGSIHPGMINVDLRTIHVTDVERRAIRHSKGLKGYATRSEVREWVRELIAGPLADLVAKAATVNHVHPWPEPEIRWVEIPGRPGYRLGSDGSFWTSKFHRSTKPSVWRQRKLKLSTSGYLRVGLYNKGRICKYFYIHQLMLQLFVGPAKPWASRVSLQRDQN